jgi:cold shock CspA family protein
MNLTGTIKVINETQTFGDKGFQKRELVLTTNEKYPQDILVEFVQDKCEILNKYKVGQDVTIGINITGREWTSPQGEVKYFNSIKGWKIDKAENGLEVVDAETVATYQKNKPQPTNVELEADSGLPF